MAKKRIVRRHQPGESNNPIGRNGRRYTEEERQQFIERAQEIGVPPACEEFGWPDKVTAYKWVRQYGVTIDVDPIRSRAARIGVMYGTEEKLKLANAIIRAVGQRLRVNPQTGEFLDTKLDAMEINRLSSALDKAVKVTELLEGRPTEITETVSELDADLRRLVTQLKTNNDAKVEELRS